MALNPTIFKTRTLTAVVFVIVMLTGLLWNPWSYLVLFSVIHFGCWLEYQKIQALINTEYDDISSWHRYSVMIGGWCLMLYCANGNLHLGSLSLHTIGWWGCLAFLFLLVAGEILQFRTLNMRNIGVSALGLLYISVSFALLTWLRTFFYGVPMPFLDSLPVLMIIGSLWINDTMAYIVGSLIGKTPLSVISPKKTWEGTLGGIILSIGVMWLIGYSVRESPGWNVFPPEWWMIISAIAAIAGTFGDLLESKLKRMAGIKDSGHIMPGHGGFLDRFDSLLIATPPACACLAWMMGFFN